MDWALQPDWYFDLYEMGMEAEKFIFPLFLSLCANRAGHSYGMVAGSSVLAVESGNAVCFGFAQLLPLETDGTDDGSGNLCRAYGMDNERIYPQGRNKVTGTAV